MAVVLHVWQPGTSTIGADRPTPGIGICRPGADAPVETVGDQQSRQAGGMRGVTLRASEIVRPGGGAVVADGGGRGQRSASIVPSAILRTQG